MTGTAAGRARGRARLIRARSCPPEDRGTSRPGADAGRHPPAARVLPFRGAIRAADVAFGAGRDGGAGLRWVPLPTRPRTRTAMRLPLAALALGMLTPLLAACDTARDDDRVRLG